MAEELTFRLEDFEGPLELLLTLVQKHKMDLHNIPILELIDQYTRAWNRPRAPTLNFQCLYRDGAHLVEMKSYLLLPRSEEGERMKQELTASSLNMTSAAGWRPSAGAGRGAHCVRAHPGPAGMGQHL